jgi:hypothetical protein
MGRALKGIVPVLLLTMVGSIFGMLQEVAAMESDHWQPCGYCRPSQARPLSWNGNHAHVTLYISVLFFLYISVA